MHQRTSLYCVAALAAALMTSPAAAWVTRIEGAGSPAGLAGALAVGSGDGIVAGGYVTNAGTGEDFTVVRLDPMSGGQTWRYTADGAGPETPSATTCGYCGSYFFSTQRFGGPTPDFASGLAVDGAGDVIASGTLAGVGTGVDAAVVKLDGATGAQVWRVTIDGPANTDDVVAGDPVVVGGDPVVAVALGYSGAATRCDVVRLAASDGTETWRTALAASADTLRCSPAAADGAGNVFGAVTLRGTPQPPPLTFERDTRVVKLDGPTGAILWTADSAGPALEEVFAIAVDSSGDVLVGGYTIVPVEDSVDYLMTITKLAGTTGNQLWRFQSADNRDVASVLAIDSTGDVFAAGASSVVKLDGATGARIWQRRLGRASSTGLAFDPAGDVVVPMTKGRAENRVLFLTAKLAGSTGKIRWRRKLGGGRGEADVRYGAVSSEAAVDGDGRAVSVGSSAADPRSPAYSAFSVQTLCDPKGLTCP